jgi:hypothetical protein
MRASAIRRAANPLSIWIALMAIVLQSVMPMAAQARMRMMAPVPAAATAAVVSHVGDGVIAMTHAVHDGAASPHAPDVSTPAHPPADAPHNPHAMHGDAPCPYCRVHLDAVALPPVPNPHWVLLVSVVPRPVTDESIPVTAEAWTPTWQRGPPPTA